MFQTFRFFLRFTAGLIFCLVVLTSAIAQVSCIPVFPNADDQVTITFDATQGNGALAGIGPVYGHFGVITNLSTSPTDWKYVQTTWAVNNAAAQMTNVGTNLWSKTFNISTFFNVPASETVLKLAFVFRNATGSIVGRASDGSDIFYEVYPQNTPLQAILLQPASTLFLANSGQSIPVKGASSAPANLKLLDNGVQLTSANNAELLDYTINASGAGVHRIDFIASTANAADTASFTYIIAGNVVTENPPAGTEWGIQYLAADKVRLSLYAPNKQLVYVIGDFNNWLPTSSHLMKRSADGTLWWIELSGLPVGQPVRFQYLVDGVLRIADPLSTTVLDPWNDPFIPPFTYPNLPSYPTGKTSGIVSVLQTNQAPFDWTADQYQRPKNTDLVVYELLMRDFIARHDYPTLLDTLDYLEQLGITAIELMPVNEFDGNISWGYNPAYHKSLDKYYGTPEALKTLVNECHKRNIAVILDVVFNQATGASPLAQLYWDAANNRPAADNPWLNPEAKHDFNVFNDFNHESLATKKYVKYCLEYWLEEFKVDGFRFDLSKGFTQKNTIGNTGAWGQYDASRVAIWKDYADFQWSVDPGSYVILEHFAENTEEKELSDYGMMLWGNMFGAYKETALGYSTTADLSGISYKARGWTNPNLIGYMESHDEERIAFECKTYGNQVPTHNIRTVPVYAQRIAMLENLMYTVPGPKMLWQFGELAYDFPINYCENGNTDPGCRTSPKPIRWDYFGDPYRRKLHGITASLLQLRKNHEVFETTDFQLNINTGQVRSIFLNHPDLNVAVFANVGVQATAVNNPGFQHIGEWYEYYTGDTLLVTSGVPTSFSLKPGEYRLYLDKYVPLPAGVVVSGTNEVAVALDFVSVQPNPATDFLQVAFVLTENTDLRMEVTDASGRRVWMEQLNEVSAGAQVMDIPTSDWKPGIYFLTVYDGKGGRMVKKVAKI
ncbi:MAG: T9SS type A sorting domain-containing protein [Chitinophagales bacterium]|nr:T9SS type A sorting domain-containing protein [Chitinophagales bacterium]